MGRHETSRYSLYVLAVFAVFLFPQVAADERCKDDSFCRAYCLSTNPETVSAHCGTDLASCICITPDNHGVKVRFIEQRNPVPPTTPRPASSQNHGVHYVNSQPLPNNYNGNGNSIVHNQQQQQPQPQNQAPVLLECDASEASTRLCHSFCLVEIRAWYGLCNITSKACVCFGILESQVQKEPIAAIFHLSAQASPAPIPTTTTTPKPTTYSPPRPGYQQLYPAQQYLNSQPHQQQQHWKPIQPTNYQSYYNNNQYYPASSPTVLNAAVAHQQHQAQGPVRSAASLFGSNGKPVSASISTPDTSAADVTGSSPSEAPSSSTTSSIKTSGHEEKGKETLEASATRRRRSINITPDAMGKKKESSTGKDLASQGECSKYKCAISCKRNNYLAPDCEPKCVDGQCWCECFPRL